MKRFSLKLSENWKFAFSIGSLATAIILIFCYRLASLTTGLDAAESSVTQSISYKLITPLSLIRESLWLPHKIYIFVVEHIPHGDLTIAARAFGVIIALSSIIGFYFIIKNWYNERVALLGTLSFALSGWLLLVGRYASPYVLYLLPILAISGWAAIQSGYKKSGLIIMTGGAIGSLYVPGLMWIVLPALIMQRKTLTKRLKAIPQHYMFALIGVAIFAALPILISIAWPPLSSSPLDAARAFAGVPSEIPTISEFAKNIWGIILHITWQSKELSLSLAGPAMISIFVTVTAGIGLFDMVRRIKLDRAKLIILWLIVGVVLSGLNINTVVILLPLIFILSAGGIRYMLNTWLHVFPFNPLARTIGITLASVVLMLSVSYQLATYFVSWPHTEYVITHFTRNPE